MGTSAAYAAPPSWGDLKSDVTVAARQGTLPLRVKAELLQSFVEHNGGARQISHGAGNSSGVAKGTSARQIAARFSGFLSEVARSGLDEALRNSGWQDLVGRPTHEILAGLLDRLGGPSSSIDDVDARMALAQLEEMYFDAAADSQELELLLLGQVDNLETVLQDYFGFYLYEVFCRVFFERLVQRVGALTAESFLGQIQDFIRSAIQNQSGHRNLSSIAWNGPGGEQIISEIMETTLRVFGG